MSWKITETNQLDQPAQDRLGNKLLIGNGYIGYRGTLEEFTKDQKTASIVSGLYDKVGDQWREPINMPNGLYLQVSYHGEALHALTSKVQNHIQTLDMFQAMHERSTTFVAKDGNAISVNSVRFASFTPHHLVCMQSTVEASQDCTLVIHTGIDGDVWDINGPHLRDIQTSQQNGVVSLMARTHEKGVAIAVSECITYPGGAQRYIVEEKRILREIELPVKAHQPQTLTKYVAYFTGVDSNDPLADSQALSAASARVGYDKLFKDHRALWEKRWQACDVQISGDEEAQQALRFSMYHLLAIAPTHASNVSIPARGLSGQVYKGGIFWDTEIFMLPFFNHAFPELARNLLLYRYHTLDGARRKAQEYGFRGAFYAWESQDTGDDACTLFNVTDVFTNRPMRTYFRDKQVHISADVAFAFWEYFLATGDASIFLDGGAEVVFECARFFLSYTYYSPDKDRYEILDVTGPDEYHERVHNNAYTNWIVARTLEVCQNVVGLLQTRHPAQAKAMFEKLAFEKDWQTIQQISARLYVPAPDPKSQVIPQFDGYFTLEDVSLKEILQRKQHPHEYLGAGCGLATTTQIIKQADVVLALFLAGEQYSPQVKTANWEYYEPRTEHGSSLSACSYAMIAAEIGKINWAYKYFMKTATIDLTGEGKQYVGPLYIGGTHPAGNGGAWMAAVFGLCGIRCSGDVLTIQPRLPEHWKEVIIPFSFQGQKVTIKLTKPSIQIQADAQVQSPIQFRVKDQVYMLSGTQAIEISL